MIAAVTATVTLQIIPSGNITHQKGLVRLRHHTAVSIAGGKICVWPQAERRSFPTIKLDMSQLVHASATLVRGVQLEACKIFVLS